MLRLSTRDAQGIATVLEAWAPFRTHGALRGQQDPTLGTGRLPSDWRRTMQARDHVIDYVIYSYTTPIAWHDTEAGWIMPDEGYSVTTSRHQSRISYAIHLAGNGGPR